MASSLVGTLSALAAKPWLWAALAAFFLGAASGEAGRWIRSRLRHDDRGAARRSALAALHLALALGAGAALLVLPPKAALADPGLLWWAAALLVLGLGAGIAPRIALPLALVLAAAGLGLALDARRGWIALDGPVELARLTPFTKEGEVWKGELILYERDSVPTTLAIAIKAASASLVVERLEFSGPATLACPASRGEIARFYRVVAIAAEGPAFAQRFQVRKAILERLEPLAERPVAEARGTLVRRERLSSPPQPLAVLSPTYFAFMEGDGGGLVLSSSDKPLAP